MPPRYLSVIVSVVSRPQPATSELRNYASRLYAALDAEGVTYEVIFISEGLAIEPTQALIAWQLTHSATTRLILLPADNSRKSCVNIAAAQAQGSLTLVFDTMMKTPPADRIRKLLQPRHSTGDLRQGSLLDLMEVPGHDDPFGAGASDLPSAANLT